MAIIYTNQSSGRKPKSKSKKLAQAREEHQKFLVSMGYSGNAPKSESKKAPKFSVQVSRMETPDLSGIGPTGMKKEEQKYTGKEIIGIAVMHKSNAVPIRSKEVASDIAKMRR
jgi:hypothetical protein